MNSFILTTCAPHCPKCHHDMKLVVEMFPVFHCPRCHKLWCWFDMMIRNDQTNKLSTFTWSGELEIENWYKLLVVKTIYRLATGEEFIPEQLMKTVCRVIARHTDVSIRSVMISDLITYDSTPAHLEKFLTGTVRIFDGLDKEKCRELEISFAKMHTYIKIALEEGAVIERIKLHCSRKYLEEIVDILFGPNNPFKEGAEDEDEDDVKWESETDDKD